MKTGISTIILGLIALLTFNSCKKENNPPAIAKERKLARIEEVGGPIFHNFTYNAQGRIAEYKNNNFTSKFDYSSSLYLVDIFNTSNVREYQIASTASANSRVTSVAYKSFKPDGSLNYNETNTFQYNTDGVALSYAYGTYLYSKEYAGGNLTKVNATNNGAFHSKREMEYYTDKPTKLNLNWFQDQYMNDFLTDKEQFGTANRNLPKKLTYTSNSGYMNTIDFSYTFDPEGYISTFTTVYKEPGAAPVTQTFKVLYQ